MKPFQQSVAIGSDPRELVNTCLAQIGDIDSSANVGFIYVTDALSDELEHILHLLQHGTGIPHWCGSTGIALCSTRQEIYDQPALVIMLAAFPADKFLVFPTLTSKTSGLSNTHQAWLEVHAPQFGVVHGDPSNPAIPELIQDLAKTLGSGFFSGGLTSSQTQNLQIADNVTSGGLSGILLSPEVEVMVAHTQGCSPIGPVRSVTDCNANIIMQIDNMSALEAIKQDVGEVLSRDLAKLGGYIFAGLPIKGSDTGDYMVRNILGFDTQEGRIAIGDHIERGDSIMFCRRDGNTAREDMLKMLEGLKKRCKGRIPRGGIYISCLGRGRHQFGNNAEEINMISEILGDFPLAGFFASGEIFHDRIYGYTGVLTLFM